MTSWLVMLVPCWIALVHFDRGLLTAWSLASLYVLVVGLLMLVRFRRERWRDLRVIEVEEPMLTAE